MVVVCGIGVRVAAVLAAGKRLRERREGHRQGRESVRRAIVSTVPSVSVSLVPYPPPSHELWRKWTHVFVEVGADCCCCI